MRLADVSAAALIAVAVLLVIQATWTPILIAPGEAGDHIGQQVRVEGMLVDAWWTDDAGRGTIVAQGAMLRAWFDDAHGLTRGAMVALRGTLELDDGLPLLRVMDVEVLQPERLEALSLAAVARDVPALLDHAITIRGDVAGRTLSDAGHSIRLVGDVPDGDRFVHGALRYHAPCLCHVLVVSDAWTPS